MLFTAGQPQSECPAHTWAMAPLPRAPWAEVVEPWMGWLGTLDEAFTCFLFFFFKMSIGFCRLPQWLSGKESACNAGDAASIPASGRSLEEGMATIPVFLPGESRGQRSLVGDSPQRRKESDTTEAREQGRMQGSAWFSLTSLLIYLSIFGCAGSSLLPGLCLVATWGLLPSGSA